MEFFQHPTTCCILGAVAVELLRIIESSQLPSGIQPNYKSWSYYINTLSSFAIAAIVGHIYFDQGKDTYGKIVYFHTGASSPLLIRTLASSLPAAIKPKK